MNNLSSYCGLVDAKIRASDKDLTVLLILFYDYYKNFKWSELIKNQIAIIFIGENNNNLKQNQMTFGIHTY